MFGALGHGINDVDTAQLMPLQSGGILYSDVAGVKRGEKGAPGERKGAFQADRDLGELYAIRREAYSGRWPLLIFSDCPAGPCGGRA